ncbi:hypothetical protein CSKR_200252 [Clonorchis sinensis]|uniref:Uncharacterized protein n=1 Tax=Clonorchis sinensis TaxID=79923 RepID=A0A8T1LZ51_CLOSI|nr:hypothetical protein CSKR_200252 [Clonorchis sinensis]
MYVCMHNVITLLNRCYQSCSFRYFPGSFFQPSVNFLRFIRESIPIRFLCRPRLVVLAIINIPSEPILCIPTDAESVIITHKLNLTVYSLVCSGVVWILALHSLILVSDCLVFWLSTGSF